MSIIVHDLPFFDVPTTAGFQGRHLPIKPDQVIVWVGATESDQTEFHSSRPFFPAILDTGHTHNFSIREEQLIQWAGLDPRFLPKYGEIRIGGDRLPLLQADLWLGPNRRGEGDWPGNGKPFCLELDSGIAVYPKATPHAPRLPLLGLRALRCANLHLTIDCRRRFVTLRTTRRSWFF